MGPPRYGTHIFENFTCGWDGEWGYFALRGELLCPRRQSNQNAAGDVGQRKHEKFLPLEIFPRFHASFPRTPVTGNALLFRSGFIRRT